MASPPDFIAGATLTAQQMNLVGMWKIATGIVNSGSSFDLNYFSADYDSYKLVLTQIRTAAASPAIQLRLVASGTPATTGYYYGITRVDVAAGTIAVDRGNNATLIDTGSIQNGAVSGMMTCEIHNPFTTQYTSVNGQSVDSRAAASYAGISFSGQLANATSYNTIRVLLASSSFTNCNYALYGYRK
jgi:hypothetical protein